MSPSRGARVARWGWRLGWLVLALPALWELATLAWAIAHRVFYPYDLEWMEGGMLHHAQRISEGSGIYGPPTIDFVPYLYTPLYPGLLAVLASVFGLSFALGRMVSVLSLGGLMLVTVAAIAGPARRAARAGADDRAFAWLGVLTALGLFAAGYPWTGGWYDLVRNDTFALLLATAGVHCCVRWARAGRGWAGQGRIAAAAAILALGFFAKQTDIFYVAAGGVIVLALNWRRVPIFVATAALIGLGGTWVMDRSTDGWFWYWIREVHQSHDFQMPRFWHSVNLLLGHFPLATTAIVLGLLVVGATAIARGKVPPAARPLLVWAPIWLVSVAVGGVGFGTQWAVFNAYMPALLHGGIACGCAIVAVAACARVLMPTELARRRGALLAPAIVIALAPAIDLWRARWSPSDFIPTADDQDAGDALVARIAAIDGDVWVTFDPWMAHQAGKPMFTHRMGIGDTGTGKHPVAVLGVDQALRDHRFAAIVLDNHGANFAPELSEYYRADEELPKWEQPRLFVGVTTKEGTPEQLAPRWIWVPAVASKPPIGARVISDFEGGAYDAWTASGTAWGARPDTHGQPPVYRFGGRYYATSAHGGDAATGRLETKELPIDGARIRLSLAGTARDPGVRAELWVGDRVVRTAQPATTDDTMVDVWWDVAPWRGKTGRIVLVDESAKGHLDVDDVLIFNDASAHPKGAAERTPTR